MVDTATALPLARPYTWSNRTHLITPTVHRDLLRLWTVHHLIMDVNYPHYASLTERSHLLFQLAADLGFTDYRFNLPSYEARRNQTTGTDLELIRLARTYTADTRHVIPGTRFMPSNACPSSAHHRMERCFTNHPPTSWRTHSPNAGAAS
jgi:hypothetical protein